MPKSAEQLAPLVVSSWANTELSAWTLNGLWTDSTFDSFPRGESALWYHTPGSGRMPEHTGYDYIGAAAVDVAQTPNVDLTLFPNAEDWTVFVRCLFRPNHIRPTLGGIDQQFERLILRADTGSEVIEIGDFGVGSDFDPDQPLPQLRSNVSDYVGGEFADRNLSLTGNPRDLETVTLGSITYTWVFVLIGDVANQIEIGGSVADSIANFAAAVNDTGAGRYSPSTVANPDAIAETPTVSSCVCTSRVEGVAGNSIVVTDTLFFGGWSGAGGGVMTGGVDVSTDPKVGPHGAWWVEQLIAPTAEQQAKILGGVVNFQLALDVAERDTTDYGIGVAKFSVEILRGNVNENAQDRGGFGGVPGEVANFPVELLKSWANSRKWS